MDESKGKRRSARVTKGPAGRPKGTASTPATPAPPAHARDEAAPALEVKPVMFAELVSELAHLGLWFRQCSDAPAAGQEVADVLDALCFSDGASELVGKARDLNRNHHVGRWGIQYIRDRLARSAERYDAAAVYHMIVMAPCQDRNGQAKPISEQTTLLHSHRFDRQREADRKRAHHAIAQALEKARFQGKTDGEEIAKFVLRSLVDEADPHARAKWAHISRAFNHRDRQVKRAAERK